MGINPKQHDIRFIQDDWESPTLGAWGLGWEVRLDGMEITQFTYFQEIGGIELSPITGEITYGTERIAMYLQQVTTSSTSPGPTRSPTATSITKPKCSSPAITLKKATWRC